MPTLIGHDMSNDERRIWGIMGGMGPLASAEFVKTIYGMWAGECEQESPSLILWSDPGMPDRTRCILSGRQDLLCDRLTESLWRLAACGVTDIVICCVTIHQVIDLLPIALRSKVISLVDVIYESIFENDRRHVLLCTNGTREAQLFERHPDWGRARKQLLLLTAEDQQRVHDLIYRVKQYRHQPEDVDFLKSIVAKYEADSLVAGCTEMHVLVRTYGLAADESKGRMFLDPLMILAERIAQPVVQVAITG